MEDCLFCKIIAGDIPSSKVYEDDLCYAFNDINPQAPTHFLVIPKQHIQSVAAVDASNSAVVAHCFEVIAKIARERGMDSFRVVSNIGRTGGPERVPPAFPRSFRTGYDLAAGLMPLRTLRGTPSPLRYPGSSGETSGDIPLSSARRTRPCRCEHGQWRKSPAEPDFFRELNRRTAVRRCLRLRERQRQAHRSVCLFVCVGLRFAYFLR